MEQKINVAELLKDCPSGMELDCTMTENVYFDKVLTNSIKCFYIKNRTKTRNTIYFTKFGEYDGIDNAKCVIFPKGKTTWEGFHRPFKDGDVVVSSLGNIHILKNRNTSYIFVDFKYDSKEYLCKSLTTCVSPIRLATEEEKQKLFDAIKANGYRWNEETKTLEELPKFKVGDVIQDEDAYKVTITEVNVEDKLYEYESTIAKGIGGIAFSEQDNWKLVPNKFDITTLKPFESRVLVRTGNRKWVAAFYGHYDKDSSLNSYLSYCVVGGLWYEQCIPYEGNEHLLNTTDDCNEFYKNWE